MQKVSSMLNIKAISRIGRAFICVTFLFHISILVCELSTSNITIVNNQLSPSNSKQNTS